MSLARFRTYDCADHMCGAEDCRTCYPWRAARDYQHASEMLAACGETDSETNTPDQRKKHGHEDE